MIKLNLPYSVISQINSIFILDCLYPEEMQTGVHCHDQLRDLCIAEKRNLNQVHRIQCTSKEDFEKTIKKIHDLSKQGILPLISIHGHGDKDKGLRFPRQDYISWHDLMEYFRQITECANGETTIIISACYSFRVIKEFFHKYEKERLSRFPVGFFYGYKEEVAAGVVEEENLYLNESIIIDGGKSIMNKPPRIISMYSEYDYIESYIAFIITIMGQSCPNSELINGLSLGQFRNEILNQNRIKGMPYGDTRRFFHTLRDSPQILLKEIIQEGMYDTERKKRCLKAIDESFL